MGRDHLFGCHLHACPDHPDLCSIPRSLFFLSLTSAHCPSWHLWLSSTCSCLPPHTPTQTLHCPLAALVQPLPLQADGFGQDMPPSCLPTGCCFILWLHTHMLLPLLATFQRALQGQNPQNTRDNPKKESPLSSHLISS